MKSTFAILALLLSSTVAQAGVIAEYTSSNYFRIRMTDTILIHDNGVVQHIETKEGIVQKDEEIAQLSTEKLELLQNLINGMTLEELQKEDPNAPQCYDAPISTYRVRFLNHRELVPVYAVRGCLPHVMPEWKNQRVANQAKNLLDGLRTLAHIN